MYFHNCAKLWVFISQFKIFFSQLQIFHLTMKSRNHAVNISQFWLFHNSDFFPAILRKKEWQEINSKLWDINAELWEKRSQLIKNNNNNPVVETSFYNDLV